jgi:hypothetical protein
MNSSLDLNLSDKCKKYCGNFKDCYKEYFHLDETRMKGDIYEDFFTFLNLPTLPNTIIKHTAKMHFEEFLCFIASIVSLWFGFSVIMLTDVCLLIVKNFIKIINRKNQIIIINQRIRLQKNSYIS